MRITVTVSRGGRNRNFAVRGYPLRKPAGETAPPPFSGGNAAGAAPHPPSSPGDAAGAFLRAPLPRGNGPFTFPLAPPPRLSRHSLFSIPRSCANLSPIFIR